jgi:prepilin-type processing-associated H-X9-DG protein
MKYKSSFTKKDLVVVLVSVAFALANLGAVGRSTGRRRAKEFACLSNLLRWGRIFQAFTNDNGGYFADRDAMNDWPVFIWAYYWNSEDAKTLQGMLLCPEATKSWEEGGRNPYMAWYDQECQDDWEYDYGVDWPVISSYCINLWVSNETGSGKAGGNRQLFWRTPHVKDASCAPILLDGQWKDADPLPTDRPPEYEGAIWTPGQNEIRRVCVNRHNGGVNGLFLDFSARKVGLKELWEIWWYRGWAEDIDAAGRPDWTYGTGWMQNFKDYYP